MPFNFCYYPNHENVFLNPLAPDAPDQQKHKPICPLYSRTVSVKTNNIAYTQKDMQKIPNKPASVGGCRHGLWPRKERKGIVWIIEAVKYLGAR